MAVNTSIWGSEEQWESTYFGINSEVLASDPEKYAWKYGFTGETVEQGNAYLRKGTVALAVQNKRMNPENSEIDNSCCYVGVDDGFNGVSTEWFLIYTQDVEEEIKADPQTYPVSVSRKSNNNTPLLIYQDSLLNPTSPYYFTNASSSTNNYRQFKSHYYTPKSYFIMPTSDTGVDYGNTEFRIAPVTKVPIQNFFLLPIVIATDVAVEEGVSQSFTMRGFDLDTYCHTKYSDGSYPFEKYPYIARVAVTAFGTAADLQYRSQLGSNTRNLNYLLTNLPFNYTFQTDEPIANPVKYNMNNNTTIAVYTTSLTTGLVNTSSTFTTTTSWCILGNASSTNISVISASNARTKTTYYPIVNASLMNVKVDAIISSTRNTRLLCWTTVDGFGGIEGFFEHIMSQTAYFGTFFSPKYNVIRIGSTTAEDMYLGIIDSSGITHGEYSHGEENKEQQQFNWTDANKQTPYIPPKTGGKPDKDPNTYDETTNLNPNPLNTGASIFTRMYALNATELNFISQFLYSIVPDYIVDEKSCQLMFLTQNPMDCIVSLQSYPLDVKSYMANPILSDIVIGNIQVQDDPLDPALPSTPHKGYIFGSNDATAILDLGEVYYFPQFNDFRDFEPYSSAELYIPYSSTVAINPSEYCGHYIGLKMIVDFTTGACIALIYRDGLVIDYATGTLGSQISVSGLQQADYNNAVYNANATLKKTNLGIAASVATAIAGSASMAVGNMQGAGMVASGIGGFISGIQNSNIAQYNLDHVQLPYKTQGTSTPVTSMVNEQVARLIVRQPVMLAYLPEVYGDTVGYACSIQSTLGSISGFTVVANINMDGIAATEHEKSLIWQLLQGGVYL